MNELTLPDRDVAETAFFSNAFLKDLRGGRTEALIWPPLVEALTGGGFIVHLGPPDVEEIAGAATSRGAPGSSGS